MTIARLNLPEGTIKLTITIPKKYVNEAREKVLALALKDVEIPGFRKGKAPKKIASQKIDKKKLIEQVASELVPKAYQEALKKELIKPIINPQVRLTAAPEEGDWQIEILTCETPAVSLGKYKNEVIKMNAPAKIWVPDKGSPKAAKEEQAPKDKDKRLQKTLDLLLQLVGVDVPILVRKNELNRRLATLIDKTEKLGMSLEQYLTSTNQTIETLKKNYEKSVREFWQLEFILNKIADEEKIVVNQAEIEKTINQTKNSQEKQTLAKQRYFLAHMLRRQKTLDFLLSL